LFNRSKWTSPAALLLIIMIATLFFQFGIGLQRTIYNNFISEELAIEAQGLGIIESIREIPGLLTIVLIAALGLFTEPVAMAVCISLLSVGLVLYGMAGGLAGLIVATTVYSVGFHLYMPVQSSMVLRLAKPGEKGRRLGELESVRALAGFLAMGFVILTARFLNYRMLFWWAAGLSLIGAVIMLIMPRDKSQITARKMIFRKSYWLYYVLIFLSGSRMHIYQIFATFFLVSVFEIPVQHMAILLGVSNVFAMVTRPIIGRFIDKAGEQAALTINYSFVILIFLGYAFVRYLPFIYFLYVLDNASMGVSMAISTFLDKIAPREEVISSLAMGSTIQHIAGVMVPVVGGTIWSTYGYQYTFMTGAFFAVISLIACRFINQERKLKEIVVVQTSES